MNTHFINRTEEKEKIENIYRQYKLSEYNKLLIVYGDKFIGKSRLIEETLAGFGEVKQSRLKFRLKIMKHNISKADSGAYISELSKLFTEYYKKYSKLRFVFHKVVMFIKNNITTIISLVSKSFNLGLVGEATNAMINYKSYNDYSNIINFTKKNSIILHVENTELIDDLSLSWFAKFLKQKDSSKVMIIFEYTTSGESYELEDFLDCFREIDNLGYEAMRIKPLNLEHCKLLLDVKLDDTVTEDLFKKFVHKSNGNIYKITSFSVENVSKKNELVPNKLIDSKISKLTNSESLLLIIIFLHDCNTKYQLLYDLVQHSQHLQFLGITKTTIDTLIKKLLDQKYLYTIGKDVFLSSDVIIDDLTTIVKDKLIYQIQLNAYSLLKDYYLFYIRNKSIVSNVLSNFQCLNRLVKLMNLFDQSSIISIGKDIIKYYNETNDYIQKITLLSSLCNFNYQLINDHQNLSNFIIKETFRLGLNNEFSNLLENVYDEFNFAHNLYMIQKYIIMDEYESNKDKINDILTLYKNDKEKNFLCKIVIFYQALNIKDKNITNKAKDITNEKKINLFAYALFLRCYTNVLSTAKSIELLNESIMILNKHENNAEMQYSNIALARKYIYSGDLNKASKLLFDADNYLSSKGYKKHYYYNNMAIIDLLSGNISKQTEMLFIKARDMVDYPYEEILIDNNLLCYYTKRKSWNKAYIYYQRLLNSIKEHKYSSWFLLRAYYNMYKFELSQHSHETESVHDNIKKLSSYKDFRSVEVQEVCNNLLYNHPLPKNNTLSFMCSKGMILGTLSDWSFDIAGSLLS